MLCHLDRDLRKVTVLKALQLFLSARNDVSKTTIANCFRKAIISVNARTIAVNDEDDPFKKLNADPNNLQQKELSLVPNGRDDRNLHANKQ